MSENGKWERGVALPGGGGPRPNNNLTALGKKKTQQRAAPTSRPEGEKQVRPQVRKAWGTTAITPQPQQPQQSAPRPVIPPAPKVNPWGDKNKVNPVASSSSSKVSSVPPPQTTAPKALAKADETVKKPLIPKPSPWGQPQKAAAPSQTTTASTSFPPLGVQPNTSKQLKQQQQQLVTPAQQQTRNQPKNPVLWTKQKAEAAAAAAASNVSSSDFPALGGGSTATTTKQSAGNDQPRKRKPAPMPVASKQSLTPSTSKETTKANKQPKKKKPAPPKQSPSNTKTPVSLDPHHVSASLHAAFAPLPASNTNASNHHDTGHFDFFHKNLLNTGGEIKKGRQRLGPRKKKFSSLKKKVLEERLRHWKELHPDENNGISAAATAQPLFTTVCLYGFCNPDEMEDDDEFEEIVSNLNDMAAKVGTTRRLFVPRSMTDNGNTDSWPAFVEFESTEAATAAVGCWDGLVLGGQELKCRAVVLGSDKDDPTAPSTKEEEWKHFCIANEAARDKDTTMGEAAAVAPQNTNVYLENALTEDDLEDEDCMEESLADIRTLASKFGVVDSIVAETERTPPCVRITYVGDEAVARTAATELNKVVIGGQAVSAKLSSEEQVETEEEPNAYILLRNVLTEDDLEDEDCLEESLNDVRELAQKFGTVESVSLEGDSPVADGDNVIRIVFSTVEEAKKGVAGFDGMVVGGLTVSASIPKSGDDPSGEGQPESNDPNEEEDETMPMYSGDKIIPERFAECKRVPKAVPSQGQRPYATLSKDETAKPLLVEMLGELMRLQKRAADDKNAKARRRVVMGLREVARGIRSHKVKLVVMANNLDEYGAIDEKLQEIIDSAHAEDVPVFYEFSKRTLGKALGKSIKIGVAGVQSAEGAHQQFKKLIKIAATMG